jgi:predicted HTH transcriptional regulator
MGNLRDGGVIIIGASERGNNWELTGIAQEHLTTYDVDDTTDAINKYASPPMQIEMVRVKYQEDREFLAFQIREFEYAPYVCRNNSPNKTGLLHEGDVYIRPPGKPQTKKVTNVQEMHDLLELAAEKYARSMIRTSRSIGLVSAQDNTRHFDKELEGL